MTDTPPVVAPPEISVSDDGLDISALRDISLAESVAEEGKQTKPKEPSEDTREEEIDEKESSEEEPDKEDSEEISEEDGEEDSSEEEDAEETDGESPKAVEKSAKYLEASKGDKQYKVPLDAEVKVTVNGKEVAMTISEAISKASGATHVAQETSRLGRDRKQLDEDTRKFNEEAERVNDNVQALMEMQDPFEFCMYYGKLKNVEPQKVFEDMVKKTSEYMDRFSQMTETERRLDAENRRYKLEARQRKSIEDREASKRSLVESKTKLEASLKAEGLELANFQQALQDMHDKVSRGESLGDEFDSLPSLSEADVIAYAIKRKIADRVTTAVEKVNKNLLQETDFIARVQKAIYATERLHGRMSPTEVTQFVKAALGEDSKYLAENLSKKVKQKTTSKPVSSAKKDEDGPTSIADYLESRRNIFSS